MGTQGMISLVGAGPGDPGLLTARGLACLRQAQVVTRDRPGCLATAAPARLASLSRLWERRVFPAAKDRLRRVGLFVQRAQHASHRVMAPVTFVRAPGRGDQHAEQWFEDIDQREIVKRVAGGGQVDVGKRDPVVVAIVRMHGYASPGVASGPCGGLTP